MPRLGAFLRPALFVLAAGLAGSAAAHGRDTSDGSRTTLAWCSRIPAEARYTLLLIRRNGPFPFPHWDGATFGNFEKRLPPQSRGYYREYTVPTPGQSDRGARRIVAGAGRSGDGATGGAHYYYTGDHYRSFCRIPEQP